MLMVLLFLGLENTLATNHLGSMYLTKLLVPLFLGLENTIATNHLGPMYLTKLLVPLLTPKVNLTIDLFCTILYNIYYYILFF